MGVALPNVIDQARPLTGVAKWGVLALQILELPLVAAFSYQAPLLMFGVHKPWLSAFTALSMATLWIGFAVVAARTPRPRALLGMLMVLRVTALFELLLLPLVVIAGLLSVMVFDHGDTVLARRAYFFAISCPVAFFVAILAWQGLAMSRFAKLAWAPLLLPVPWAAIFVWYYFLR